MPNSSITFKTKQSFKRDVEGNLIFAPILITITHQQLLSYIDLKDLKTYVLKAIKEQSGANVKINDFYINLLLVESILQLHNALGTKGQDFYVDVTILTDDEVNILKTINRLKQDILSNQTELVKLGNEREALLERLGVLENEILNLTAASQKLRKDIQDKLEQIRRIVPQKTTMSHTLPLNHATNAPTSMFAEKSAASKMGNTATLVSEKSAERIPLSP